jgi:NADH dehydrogenase (ubiquinone) 1 alpha subcomplex subunit 12
MSTLGRTLKNIMRAGPASAWKQLNTMGDTKFGALIGTDAVGNKFYENNDEIFGTLNPSH